MFQLSKEEADTISRSQIVTMKADDDKRGHNIKYLPYVFTEQGVYSIKASFKSCSSLKCVKLPKSLKIISNQAFYDCPSLKELTIRINLKDYLSLENEIDEEVRLDDEMIKIYFKWDKRY